MSDQTETPQGPEADPQQAGSVSPAEGGNSQTAGNNPSYEHVMPLLIRLAFMIGFLIVLYVVGWLVVAIAAGQLAVALIRKGEPNRELQVFTDRLTAFAKECYDFVAFVREDKPFPFREFPKGRS